MIKWNITYTDENPNTEATQQHCAAVYAKDLPEALEKIESVTGRKITGFTFNLEELRNGVK